MGFWKCDLCLATVEPVSVMPVRSIGHRRRRNSCLSMTKTRRVTEVQEGMGVERRDLEGVWQEIKNAKGSRALMEGYQTL